VHNEAASNAAAEKPRTTDLNKAYLEAFEEEDSERNENSRGLERNIAVFR
jgi:hypothetical protein